MEHLYRLRLSEVRIHEPWTKAPLGTLLQMRADDVGGPVLGIRSFYPFANGRREGLLIVSGKHAGRLVLEGSSLSGPALDVSEHVEIALVDPAPFTQDRAPTSARVFCDSATPRTFLMRITTFQEQGGAAGFIDLKTGAFHHDGMSLIGVARTTTAVPTTYPDEPVAGAAEHPAA